MIAQTSAPVFSLRLAEANPSDRQFTGGGDQTTGCRRPASIAGRPQHGWAGAAGRVKGSWQQVDQGGARSILLGTPNYGSLAPALVLTRDYPTTQWLERLDLSPGATKHVADVYSSFVGLCEMLPAPDQIGGFNLFVPGSYPQGGPELRAAF